MWIQVEEGILLSFCLVFDRVVYFLLFRIQPQENTQPPPGHQASISLIWSWPWVRSWYSVTCFSGSHTGLRVRTSWELWELQPLERLWGQGAAAGWGPVSQHAPSCVLASHWEISAPEHWFCILMLLGSVRCPQVHCSHQDCATSSCSGPCHSFLPLHLPSYPLSLYSYAWFTSGYTAVATL